MGNLGFMKAFLVRGELSEGSREEKVAYDERIVFATMRSMIPGWKKPADWGSFSLDEKETRLIKLKAL